MQLEIDTELMERIVGHCQEAYPREGCGILLGNGEDGHKVVVDILCTANAREAGAQHNRYLIPPEALLEGELLAEARGLEVIGYFHSHPDHPAQPSEFDREHAWPWYSYVITSVREGRAVASRSWLLREDRTAFDEETVVSGRSPRQGQSELNSKGN